MRLTGLLGDNKDAHIVSWGDFELGLPPDM